MRTTGGPWVDVVRIREGTGPRGAALWKLTLSCGHHTQRQVSSGDWKKEAYRIALGLTRYPPRRVRCVLCLVLSQEIDE